ncbi:MAG TPA: hypothetical protein VHL80_03485 [Polyangia bacterium]|nr:hypothetical protein [Polyangia bacterium]
MPRLVNVILAVWVLVSAFLWRHSWAQRSIGVVFGVVAFAFALAALYSRQFRWVSAFVGGLLVAFGLFVTRLQAATEWNDIVVGAAMVVASLVPDRGADISTRQRRASS